MSAGSAVSKCRNRWRSCFVGAHRGLALSAGSKEPVGRPSQLQPALRSSPRALPRPSRGRCGP
eukprot:2557467-Pyramimonas_sp.AAC.1